MVMPKKGTTSDGDNKALGVFVQCNPDTADTP